MHHVRGELLPNRPDVRIYKFNVDEAKHNRQFHGATCDVITSNLTKITQYCLKDLSCWKTIQALQTFGCKERTGVAALHIWHDQLKEAGTKFPYLGYNVEVNLYNQETKGVSI